MTNPPDQAPGTSSQEPLKERDPLFSFAHEAAPDPRDAALAAAFNAAAAPGLTLARPQSEAQHRDGDPELTPAVHAKHIPNEELDTPHDLQEYRDQGPSF